jgi:hypothetical protein
MGLPRSLAEKLLRAILRYAPEDRCAWVEAMLRELDFIGGEWPALSWALGCTTVVFRECLSEWGAWLWSKCTRMFGIRTSKEENKMNETGKNTLGVLIGVVSALALGVLAFLLRNVIADALATMGIQRSMMSHILSVIVPTELIVVGAAVLLWRRKRAAVAVGLLVPALLMGAHLVVHLASH